ncbi:hypothetical protein Q3G72_005265 [Acer saccharum]|nr:hypothetical protein Q3G72_005265 [Acer saccharum]
MKGANSRTVQMLFHCLRRLCRVVVDHSYKLWSPIVCLATSCIMFGGMMTVSDLMMITTRFVLHSLIQASLSSSYNYSFFWVA